MADEKKDIFEQLFEKDQVAKDLKNASPFKSFVGAAVPIGTKTKQKESLVKKIVPSKPGSIVLQVSILLAIMTFSFFTSQNSTRFELFSYENPAKKLEFLESRSAELESEILVQENLMSILLLENMALLGNDYLYNLSLGDSNYLSDSKKDDYQNKAEAQEESIIEVIGQLQTLIQKKPSSDELTASRTVIEGLMSDLSQSGGENSDHLNTELLDLEATRILMANFEFRNQVLNFDLESYESADLVSLLESYADISQSPAARITQIKKDFISWSHIWLELEDEVRTIDPLFGTELKGNLSLNELSFSSERNEIEITGETMTSDSKNFTLVSNLIDDLEDSDWFMNVVSRVFNKNDTGEDEFVGSFRIELNLENHE